MECSNGRNEGGEYAEALEMLHAKDMDALRRWSAIRIASAPENQPSMVALRPETRARAEDLVEGKRRRIAAELVLPCKKVRKATRRRKYWRRPKGAAAFKDLFID